MGSRAGHTNTTAGIRRAGRPDRAGTHPGIPASPAPRSARRHQRSARPPCGACVAVQLRPRGLTPAPALQAPEPSVSLSIMPCSSRNSRAGLGCVIKPLRDRDGGVTRLPRSRPGPCTASWLRLMTRRFAAEPREVWQGVTYWPDPWAPVTGIAGCASRAGSGVRGPRAVSRPAEQVIRHCFATLGGS